MTPPELEIRAVFTAWQRATQDADLPALLALLHDDAIFLTAGQPPMTKADFARSFAAGMGRVQIRYGWELRDLQVSGDLAACWNQLEVTVTPVTAPEDAARALRRVGDVLTVLKRDASGRWQLFRDANLLVVQPSDNR